MNRFILLIFFLFSALHLFIAYHLPLGIPENNFPYRDILYKYFVLYPLTPFANFDGYQYISIARNGYSELQQSYFPLFPGIVFVTAQVLFKNYILSGVAVSWVFFLLGLFYFKKLGEVILGSHAKVTWAILFIAAFPTAFYYQVIYTESLFLFLSAAALYYLYTKKLLWAAVFSILASLTKIQGVLLLIPFVLYLLAFKKSSLGDYRSVLTACAPLYGLLGYMYYLFVTYKDPLYFYHAQASFGAERSVDKIILLPQVLYRYIKIFTTSQMNFTYVISLLEFLICIAFVGVLGYEIYRLIRIRTSVNMQQVSLQVYSLVVLLLPTLTGTLTSLPRYALISFGFFFILAKISQTFTKVALLFLFLVLHIILYVLFLKGYFIS